MRQVVLQTQLVEKRKAQPLYSIGCRTPWVQNTVALWSTPQRLFVWAIFSTCATGRFTVICSLCFKQIKCDNSTGHHTAHCEQYQKGLISSLSSSSHSISTPTLHNAFSAASSGRYDSIARGVSGLIYGSR